MTCGTTVVIKGLENCVIENRVKVVVEGYDNLIQDIVLRQYDRTLQNNKEKITELGIYFYPLEFHNCTNKELRNISEKIAKEVVRKLIAKNFDIYNLNIEGITIYELKDGKATANSEITIRNIEDGSRKTQLTEDELVLDNKDDKLELVAAIQETNPIQKFENLYEILRRKCGDQVEVTKKIKRKFSRKYGINCGNRNIDPEYVKKHSDAEYQDDFTYLRTMISHGGPEYSEKIEKRLYRETRKIVKVINDLEKNK